MSETIMKDKKITCVCCGGNVERLYKYNERNLCEYCWRAVVD